MGQSFQLFRTHADVPDDVKGMIEPMKYTPAPPEERPCDHEVCEDCGQAFGWFTPSVNCDWCGRQLCKRCCPERYLLGGHPGCGECTRTAFRIRRETMLEQHLESMHMAPEHEEKVAVPAASRPAPGESAKEAAPAAEYPEVAPATASA